MYKRKVVSSLKFLVLICGIVSQGWECVGLPYGVYTPQYKSFTPSQCRTLISESFLTSRHFVLLRHSSTEERDHDITKSR